MANTCVNYISITGDKELLQLFADDYLVKEDNGDYSLDFNVISPIPESLDCDEYFWKINNWGNKWDGTSGYVEIEDEEIYIDVETAWSPCDKIVMKLISLCPGLNFEHEYYEPSEGFIGWIKHYADEDAEEYSDVFYNVSYNPSEYWYWTFEREYENFDWLSDHLGHCVNDGTITQEDRDVINSMIGRSELRDLIEYCLEKGVLWQ